MKLPRRLAGSTPDVSVCSPTGSAHLRNHQFASFEFTLAAIAQNLRRLAKLAARPPPDKLVACVA
jgi:hypothetical protein